MRYSVQIAVLSLMAISASSAHAGWTYEIAGPQYALPDSAAGSIFGDVIGGYVPSVAFGDYHAVVWENGLNSPPLDLHLPWAQDDLVADTWRDPESGLLYAVGDTQNQINETSNSHAILWKGSAKNYVVLDPPRTNHQAFAIGISGGYEVGLAVYKGLDHVRAILWHSTPNSFVDLTPDIGSAAAYRIDANAGGGPSGTQVGYWAHPGSEGTAVMWKGTADSMVVLGPPGVYNSTAYGVSGNTQVGFYSINYYHNSFANSACLWHGSADSFVSLAPAGWPQSFAYGVDGDVEVGTVMTDAMIQHAALWRGSASSFVDLNAFLEPFASQSKASGVQVDSTGITVVGSALVDGGWLPVAWHESPD
jgi:hypothetical protein